MGFSAYEEMFVRDAIGIINDRLYGKSTVVAGASTDCIDTSNATQAAFRPEVEPPKPLSQLPPIYVATCPACKYVTQINASSEHHKCSWCGSDVGDNVSVQEQEAPVCVVTSGDRVTRYTALPQRPATYPTPLSADRYKAAKATPDSIPVTKLARAMSLGPDATKAQCMGRLHALMREPNACADEYAKLREKVIRREQATNARLESALDELCQERTKSEALRAIVAEQRVEIHQLKRNNKR